MPGRDLWRARPTGGGRATYHRTREEAEAWLTARLGRDDGNFDPDRPLGEYLNHWYAIRAPSWSIDTRDTYFYQMAHLAPISTLPLRSLRADHLERVKAELLTRGLTRKHVANVVGIARQALRDAVAWQILERSSWGGVTVSVGPALDPDGYDVAEARALLKACATHRFGHGFALALDAGLRWGELGIVRWADLELGQGLLRVRLARKRRGRIAPPKWGRERSVDLSLSLPLLRVARARTPEAIYVLDHDGRPYDTGTLRLDWQAFVPAIPLRYLPPHRALRATSATLRLLAGEPLPDVAADLGHASTATTSRYLSPSARRRRAGADGLAALLDGEIAVTSRSQRPESLSGQG